VSIGEGVKHESGIHCDELVSLPKTALTTFVGSLPARKLDELKRALRVALDVED
jgi:mRNA interferase MazF